MQKEGYVVRDQTLPHFITATVVDWINVLTRKSYRDCVIESIKYCIENKSMVLYGYVIMSNHIHLVVQSDAGELSNLLRDFKKFTAKNILEKIQTEPESRREWMLEYFQKSCEHLKKNQNYNVWQGRYHAEIVQTNCFIKQKVNYIHNNPVKDKIVIWHEDYYFSLASNYAGVDYEIEVVLVDLF